MGPTELLSILPPVVRARLSKWRKSAPVLVLLAVLLGVGVSMLVARPPDPAARLAAARDLLLARQPRAAMTEVRRALAELGPGGDTTLRLNALARAAQIADYHLTAANVRGAAAEALALYRQLVDGFPNTPEAFDAGVRIAEILRARAGGSEQAEKQFLDVARRFPRQAGIERLFLQAAQLAQDARAHDRARAHAGHVVEHFAHTPAAAEAQLLIGRSFHLEGRHAHASEAYAAVADRWPGTEAAPRALHEAGHCFVEQGDYAAAIARYMAALPTHPDPMAVQRSLERARKGFVALREMAPGRREVAFGPFGVSGRVVH